MLFASFKMGRGLRCLFLKAATRIGESSLGKIYVMSRQIGSLLFTSRSVRETAPDFIDVFGWLQHLHAFYNYEMRETDGNSDIK